MKRLLLLPLLCLAWIAAADVAVPPLRQRVTDLTGTLAAPQQQQLENQLQQFESRKGSQVAVLIVPSTAPETIEQYSLRVVEAWKVGRKGVDDGALLLVAKDDRALRIEVGYGLEGVLPDAIAKRIISEVITPHFKAGDFFGGIQAGVASLTSVIDGEPLPAPPAAATSGGGGNEPPLGFLVVLAFMFSGLARSSLGRGFAGVMAGGIGGVVTWLVMHSLLLAGLFGFIIFVFILLAGGTGGRRSSGYSGGRSGFGGFSSSSGGGGGFSGGGGSFGGGGASGRW